MSEENRRHHAASAKVQRQRIAIVGRGQAACSLHMILLLEGQRRLVRTAVAIFALPVRSSSIACSSGIAATSSQLRIRTHISVRLFATRKRRFPGSSTSLPAPPNHTSMTFGTSSCQPIDHRRADVASVDEYRVRLFLGGHSRHIAGQASSRRPGPALPRLRACIPADALGQHRAVIAVAGAVQPVDQRIGRQRLDFANPRLPA
jgi:hypothetical protein